MKQTFVNPYKHNSLQPGVSGLESSAQLKDSLI